MRATAPPPAPTLERVPQASSRVRTIAAAPAGPGRLLAKRNEPRCWWSGATATRSIAALAPHASRSVASPLVKQCARGAPIRQARRVLRPTSPQKQKVAQRERHPKELSRPNPTTRPGPVLPTQRAIVSPPSVRVKKKRLRRGQLHFVN